MTISRLDPKTVKRLPLYLQYFNGIHNNSEKDVDSNIVAVDLKMKPETVQRDFSTLCQKDKNATSFSKTLIVNRIKAYTNLRHLKPVIVIGAGRLGRAFLGYSGFMAYDLDVIAAFDVNPKVISKRDASGKPVFHVSELNQFCQRFRIEIGIISVPANRAQETLDLMIQAGIGIIWNFSSIDLKSPKGIILKNQDLTKTLVEMSNLVIESHEDEIFLDKQIR